MTPRYRVATAVLLFFFLALAGCDTTDSGTGDGPTSRVELHVTVQTPDGNEGEMDLSGTVHFADGVDSTTMDQGFGLYAEPSDNPDFAGSSATLFRFGDRPAPGTYEVVAPSDADDDEFTGRLHIEQQNGPGGTLNDPTGTLTIDASSSERVKGSFVLDGELFGVGAAHAEGTFDAGRRSRLTVPSNRR